MYTGKKTCNQLKAIRKQIADANEIEYQPTECTHDGPCSGTCPKCESEMRYIEREIQQRISLGKKVAIVGLATGLSSAFAVDASAQCVKKDTVDNQSITENQRALENELVGKVELEGEKPSTEYVYINVDYPDDEEDRVYIVSEQMPQFPGGEDAMRKYLVESIKYPALAGELGVGRVFVSFVIDKDGSVTDAQVVRGVDPLLDKEALRVVNAMPKWEPGIQYGKAVKVKYTVPINFSPITPNAE
ncbi:MAG: energy transducer TonB [Bacteroidales bacterium]|nr:energy transducer TonB [Bacteroidales bacterium]